MKKISIAKIGILFLFCLSVSPIFAQSYTPAALNVAGGNNTINGQFFEYSVGEMTLIHTAGSDNIIITQGLLQPQDFGTGISDYQLTDGQITVFPNPTEDIVNIDVNLPSSGSLQLHVYDLSGKLITQKEFAAHGGKETTSLSFGHLAAGSYVLNTIFETNGTSYSRNFKILKIK